MAKSERKKKKKLTGMTVLVCLLIVFVVYMGVSIVTNSGGSMKTYIARKGEATESFTVDGYIFKNQTVITSPKEGYLECAVSESGRVSKGGIVAYIYDDEVDAATRNRIREIDEKIAKLEGDKLSVTASENDAVRLEQDVAAETVKLAGYVRDNNMDGINEVRENLEGVVESKRKIAGLDDGDEETIKKLREEKAQLESRSNVSKTAVTTEVSGSFTARVDGLEEMLGEDKLQDISRSYLKALDDTKIRTEVSSKAAKGAPIGKVTDTYTWYFAAIIDSDTAESLKTGDGIRLKFLDSSDNIISGTVSAITDENDGEAVLTIKSSEYVDNLYSMSKARVEIIKATYEGIKIPAKSVRVNGDKKGVYIVYGKKVKFSEAEVYYIDDDWAVVSQGDGGIKLYDEVIVSGSNIYEGKVVR